MQNRDKPNARENLTSARIENITINPKDVALLLIDPQVGLVGSTSNELLEDAMILS
jgi:hypothetical protein